MPKFEKTIVIATLAAPHGIRGEIRVKVALDDFMNMLRFKGLKTEAGQALTFSSIRPLKDDMCIARIAGVESREAAEALKGQKVLILRSALPPPDEDEFYYSDLIGLRAVAISGTLLGEVAAVHNHGAGDYLEIKPDESENILVPFTKAAVPQIDFDAGTLSIDLPQEG